MPTFTRLVACTLLALSCIARPTHGQNATTDNRSVESPIVTAKAIGERVRFAAPGEVVQLRLEVMADSGQIVFDVRARGNVLDWTLADTAGARLQDGTYVCLLTVKSVSGRLSQRIGSLEVRGQKISLQAADPLQLSPAQRQGIGPLEGQAVISVLEVGEDIHATTTTHDGTLGSLARTTGALSFRLGDLFAGEDKEQMRLTEEGNLGIGTSDPKVKLDVAGDMRASGSLRVDKGIEFADGTVQTSGLSGRRRDDGTIAPNATGTGTQNRIAKWTDNAGTLGDSIMTNTGSNVGLGVTSPGDLLDIAGAPNAAGRSGIHVRTTTSAGNATMYFDNDRNNFAAYGGLLTGGSTNPFSFFGVSRADRTFLFADGPSSLGLGIGTLVLRPVIFGTNNAERMRIESAGNVGIGTTTPAQKLDVAGAINTSTQYNIANIRVLSTPGTANTFAGVNAGNSNISGAGNSFFGNSAGIANSSGSSNSFVGSNAGATNLSGGGNSFFGTDAGFANSAGHFNSFFGNQAGRNNTASNNSFFGQNAGFSNTTGTFNSFFGLAAGFANNEGFFNSFFGYRAGASTFGPTASANSFFGNQAGEANSSGNSNSFFGASAGQNNSTGTGNSFFGTSAGYLNTDGINNSFFGIGAGFNNTASANSFFGFNAGMANTTGTDNVFMGGFTGQANTTGNNNSFFGRSAGSSNTEGSFNSFFGATAGQNNTTSCCNSFFGVSAGHSNTTGTNNSFFGTEAGGANETGTDNAFFGRSAGTLNVANNNSFFGSLAGDVNTMGANNTFFGANAGGASTSGSGNLVIGSGAGLSLVAGSNNIYLANAGADESNHIRIGNQGTQTATFIAGVSGTVVTGDAVLVDANGQLGVAGASSRRFKQDIGAMGNASSKLMQLRPVVFRYRPEYVAGKSSLQYGLIAEEVAKVYPELVGYGADGKPQTVRYHLLNTMLLNEMQKQEMHIQSQAQQLRNQAQQITDLEARLRRLEAQRRRRTR